MNKFVRVIVMLGFALGAARAHAVTVDWGDADPILINAGLENPLVLVGFNPQPEPPALVQNAIFDPTALVLERAGVEPTPFQLYLGARGGEFVYPPDPIDDFDQQSIQFVTDGGNPLQYLLDFSPTVRGADPTGISDPGNPFFFNPQPEPPAAFDSAIGLSFLFKDLTNVDTVSLRLQVFDGNEALGISPVPLPAAVWLFGSALLGLIGWSSRKSATR